MGPGPRTLPAAAALLALLLGAGASGGSAGGPYPVWWSRSLGLQSLDRVEERLRRPLWPGEEGLRVFKGTGEDRREAVARDCVSLKELTERGYWAAGNLGGRQAQRLQLARCTAIEMLGGAEPAKTSFVHHFVLSRNALSYLPAMVSVAPGCEARCWQYFANTKGVALAAVDENVSVDLQSPYEMRVTGKYESTRIEVVGRADFNGDELEDLLVVATTHVTEGTWGGTELFLLTRDASHRVLHVVDAESHLCAEYQCDDPIY